MEKQNYVLKYREKHPRCRYCLFKKHITPPMGNCCGYNKCILKDRRLTEWDFIFWIWQGCFCKWFKAREDNIDI